MLGPTLLHRWTAGQLDVDPLPFAVLTTAALCHGLWLSNANLLLATNRQGEFAYAALAVAALTCLGALLIGPSGGLLGLASASLAGEAAMVVLVLPKMARTTAFVAPLAPQPREA